MPRKISEITVTIASRMKVMPDTLLDFRAVRLARFSDVEDLGKHAARRIRVDVRDALHAPDDVADAIPGRLGLADEPAFAAVGGQVAGEQVERADHHRER